MKIICLIREPFIDKIPNLKTLLRFLSEKFEIILISSKEKKYPEPSFLTSKIRLILVNRRTRLAEPPTSVKLALAFVYNFLKFNPGICIGGDVYGNIILSFFRRFLKFRHFYLMLEYPQIVTKEHPGLGRVEKLEIKSLKLADHIIVHDKWHSDFLEEHLFIPSKRTLLLPNATATVFSGEKGHYFQELLNLNSHVKVILHSGGLGKWFSCKEVAESTHNWPDNTLLVFHTSHNVVNDQYYREMMQGNYKGRVAFSTRPVSSDKLDSLVSSAYIGLAIYSTKILGYRAELLGLAAGKVGNYLKCGVPVIASKLSSFEYISEYNCGILVKNEAEIANAIRSISENYNGYSKNAIRCYNEKWESSGYLNKILVTLENNQSNIL
jgi:glycosyltransferase involved in cell wall biosynthesis